MSREWFISLSEEFTKPDRHLFVKSPNGHYYTIDRNSHLNPHHLELLYFVGQIIGMAAYHSRVFQTHFTPTIYKVLAEQFGSFFSHLLSFFFVSLFLKK